MHVNEFTPSMLNTQNYFSDDYFSARKAFLKAASNNPNVQLIESIPIKAMGYHGEELTIDIACLGSLVAKKILIHIGGTHGVEGFAGSAIASNLLENPPQLDSDTAIIFVHALNAYGMRGIAVSVKTISILIEIFPRIARVILYTLKLITC